jgi:FdhD protein
VTGFSSAALPPAYRGAARRVWRRDLVPQSPADRFVPEETPVAFSYEGASYAVMMATPTDLEDFALGFSLTEGLIATPDGIKDLDIVATEDGVVLRMRLADEPAATFWARRRYLAGPSGCGLCGLESLAEAARPPRPVGAGIHVPGAAILEAIGALPTLQPMNRVTGALHAAALWLPRQGIAAVREDVGRHNALDKLCGATALAAIDAARGVLLLTSRVSVEMVQKAACLGASILAAVSAPTALAVRAAEAAGITLVAVARRDGFETFTHPHRITEAGDLTASAARSTVPPRDWTAVGRQVA